MHCVTNMSCKDVQNRQNFQYNQYNSVKNGPFSKKATVNRQMKTKKNFFIYIGISS